MRPVFALLCAGALVAAPSAAPVDDAFRAYWNAATVADAVTAAAAIAPSGVDFDGAWTRLKAGRAYPAAAPRGLQKFVRHALIVSAALTS